VREVKEEAVVNLVVDIGGCEDVKIAAGNLGMLKYNGTLSS
jgi:hypothetical protein